jgi:hypothetical protein
MFHQNLVPYAKKSPVFPSQFRRTRIYTTNPPTLAGYFSATTNYFLETFNGIASFALNGFWLNAELVEK